MTSLSSTSGAEVATPESRAGGIAGRILRFLWRHALLLLVLAAGLTLRVLMIRAYPHALHFSDSTSYVRGAFTNVPYEIRPFGYSILLKPFVPGPLERVAVAQHVVGLLMVLGAYAFLVRRGAWRWLAALAVVPIALDARALTLEHFVLAETTYVAFTAAGIFLLAWREKIGAVAAAFAGLLLGFAAISRSVGLPILALVLLYLIVRRAGWARILAFLVPAGLILGGYMVWYHQTYQVYAMGQYQGRFLYARVMTVADCATLDLTEKQRTLCPADIPASWRERPDNFLWSPDSPARKLYPGVEHDEFFNEFAMTVIKQQPLDFAGMVLEETGWHLRLKAPLSTRNQCLMDRWIPPAMPGADCNAPYFLPTPSPMTWPAQTIPVPNPLGEELRAYGRVATTPGPLYAVGVLLALTAAAFRPRRVPWRDAADSLLLVGTGFGLIVVSVGTSIFDYRYSSPAVLFVPVGIALAVKRISDAARQPKPVPAGAPAPEPVSPAPPPTSPTTEEATADHGS